MAARLVHDAQIGTLWEGTSNINALDVVQRAVGKAGGHRTLSAALKDKYERFGFLARPIQGPAGRHARSRRALRRGGRRRPEAGEALSPGRRRALARHDGGLDGLGGATLGAQGGDARRGCCRAW